MKSVTTIFFSIVGLSLIALLLLNANRNSMKLPDSDNSIETSFLTKSIEKPKTPEPEMTPTQTKVYRFNNPALAYQVLTALDIFEPAPPLTGPEKKRHYAFLGLKKDKDYCKKHRAYVSEHPEFIFEGRNFFIEEPKNSFTRTLILKPLGNDMHPLISSAMPSKKKSQQLFDLRPDISIFFTKNNMQSYMDVGTHCGCMTQQFNHIPGHGSLSSKDLVAKHAMKYGESFKNRTHCFNNDKFFPKTWLLYDKKQCKEFFSILNSQHYKNLKKERRIVYIGKVGWGSHRGEGVEPINDKVEQKLIKRYANGNKCGQVKKNYLVQNYVHNPLLLDGHKFDFRMYMLIASTNPLIAYYHDGFLRVTLAEYDVNSDEKKVLLTNLALNQQIYDDVQGGQLYNGMDEEALKQAQQWSFDKLQAHLLEKGIISDPNWLDNYLRPEFKKAMIHLIRSTSDTFLRRSPLYNLYGVDFMLDRNLNLWFIEANSGPAFHGYSQPMEKFILKMHADHLEIATGLLRSRVKRIINYVNHLIDSGDAKENKKGKVEISYLKNRQEVFQEITMNYFEEEYEPKPTNGFSKIIDEHYSGVQRYRGLIEQDCL